MAERVWRFGFGRAVVALEIEYDYGYRYDGDDPEGEVQAKLDGGEYVAFDSSVHVYWNGAEIGSDHLSGSVYDSDKVHEFWTAHRDPDPMNRNCSIMRAARGGNVCIGHYFPDMVSQAVKEAREWLADACAKPARQLETC